MLRLAQERERMTVINDQFGAPTGAALLANVTALALQASKPLTGVYHLAAAGETTWYDYAQYVLAKAKALKPSLNYAVRDFVAVTTSDFPTPAMRPLNSRLNCSRLEQALQLKLPPWQAGVDEMLTKIL
jgi:dTDP-4-dehydrorhamnose reductase